MKLSVPGTRIPAGKNTQNRSAIYKEKRSALWKHYREKHSREIQQFLISVTGVYTDLTTRYLEKYLRMLIFRATNFQSVVGRGENEMITRKPKLISQLKCALM